MTLAVPEPEAGAPVPAAPVPTRAPDVYGFPPINPANNELMLFLGRKGSGKSQLARELFRNWPGVDRLIIDATGDADPGNDIGHVEMLRTIPRAVNPDDTIGLPPRPKVDGKEVPGIWRYIGNPMSPTYYDDLDRAIGLGLFPRNRPVLEWIDEARTVMRSNATGPFARTLLEQSRHFHTSALICCPRPVTIDPLVLAQADRVVVFDVPAKADRERLADTLGYDRGVWNQWCNIVAQRKYWFLMFVASEHETYLCPPIRPTGGTTGGQLSS